MRCRRSSTSQGPRRGFLIIDAIAGLLLISVVGAMLLLGVYGAARVQARLADERAAARVLEQAMVDLSVGSPLPTNVKVEEMTPAGATPRWVQVTMEIGRGRQMSLTGAVKGEN